mgnify:CR=1 FL=1
MQITTSWHEKGRAEGRMEGNIEAKREVISKYLDRRFGNKSTGLQQKIQQIISVKALDYVLEELFAANTLDEARAIINDGASK